MDEVLRVYTEKCGDHDTQPHTSILSAISNNRSIEKLQLQLRGSTKETFNSRLTDRDVIVLVDALIFASKANAALTIAVLDLSFNELGQFAVEALSKLLQEGVHVDDIRVASNSITEEGVEEFLTAVGKSSLKSLTLSDNKLGCKVGFALAKLIQDEHCGLEGLSIDSIEMDTASIVAFATALRSNKSLRVLSLSNPRLFSNNEETATHLARALERHPNLECVTLEKHFIGDDGAARLAEHLSSNFSVLSLSLAKNRISPPGASCLANYLSLNPPLQTLSLSHNRLGDQGAQAIARALRSNRNLTNLSLRGCGIGEDGLIALADAISSNPSICSFQLWGNSFSRKAAKAFHDLLKDSDRGFAHIDFFTNEVDEQIDIVRVE